MSGPAYEWKLRELMARRGMFSTSDLIGPLAVRGIELSRSQVYRLVAETPERVHLSMLLALCDILGCQLTDIAVPVEEQVEDATMRSQGVFGANVDPVPIALVHPLGTSP